MAFYCVVLVVNISSLAELAISYYLQPCLKTPTFTQSTL